MHAHGLCAFLEAMVAISPTTPDHANNLTVARWRVYFLRRGLHAHRSNPGPRNAQWHAKEADYARRLDGAITEFVRLHGPPTS
jgi:hypothetical protein